MKKLVIIPAYNEMENIIATVNDIKENAKDFDYVIINDKSTDDTYEVCKKNNLNVLHDFYDKFAPIMEDALQNMEKKAPTSTGESCPDCGSELVIRKGRFGEFVACSNYPNCKYIKKDKKEETEVKVIAKCPKCQKDIIERKTKKGKIFYGCSGYPKCDYASWYRPTGDVCKKCGNLIVNKNNVDVCEQCEK